MSDDPAVAFRPDLRGPDADLLRHVLGHYPTGVAVITAHTEQGPVGMAMNSFTSLSLHPPLVLFCPAASSTTWPALRAVGRIAINVLSAGQEALSRKFATKAVDRFSEESWSVGENGAPLLHDALGWLECTVQSESAAGDHTVVIAEIERMNVHWEITEPLVFFRGRYYPGMTAAVEATEPIGTAEPDQTAQPDQPAEPIETAQPDQPAEPIETAQPDQPVEAVGSLKNVR